MRTLMITLAALTIAGPTLAQTSQPAPPAAPVAPAPTAKKAKMVCEDSATTGSRLSKRRICMTAEQWAEQRALARREIERSQSMGYNRGE